MYATTDSRYRNLEAMTRLTRLLCGLAVTIVLAVAPFAANAERAADIEQRLIDLQIRITTLRSLAANVAPAATDVAPQQPFRGARLAATGQQQIAALENEVRTLSAKVKQLSGRPSAIVPAATTALVPAKDNRPPAAVPAGAQNSAPGWSSSTTVSPNTGRSSGDRLGEILPGTVYPGQAYPGSSGNARQGDPIAGWAKPNPPIGSAPTNDAETEYQTAYGYLLQQDYGAAQAAFKTFLARYPNTALAGNAQYWIGETYYVRGAYKDAAVAFLKGYEKYGDGNKGPDSLLKLGLSLGKLRQNDAACSSLRELGSRYANAPEAVLARGRNEMRSLRCPSN